MRSQCGSVKPPPYYTTLCTAVIIPISIGRIAMMMMLMIILPQRVRKHTILDKQNVGKMHTRFATPTNDEQITARGRREQQAQTDLTVRLMLAQRLGLSWRSNARVSRICAILKRTHTTATRTQRTYSHVYILAHIPYICVYKPQRILSESMLVWRRGAHGRVASFIECGDQDRRLSAEPSRAHCKCV